MLVIFKASLPCMLSFISLLDVETCVQGGGGGDLSASKALSFHPFFSVLGHLELALFRVTLFFMVYEIECWLGLVSSGFMMTHNSRITVCQPVFIEGTTSTFFSGLRLTPDSTGVQTQFSELRGYSIIREKYPIGL